MDDDDDDGVVVDFDRVKQSDLEIARPFDDSCLQIIGKLTPKNDRSKKK